MLKRDLRVTTSPMNKKDGHDMMIFFSFDDDDDAMAEHLIEAVLMI